VGAERERLRGIEREDLDLELKQVASRADQQPLLRRAERRVDTGWLRMEEGEGTDGSKALLLHVPAFKLVGWVLRGGPTSPRDPPRLTPLPNVCRI
jgi:hypothetical protein